MSWNRRSTVFESHQVVDSPHSQLHVLMPSNQLIELSDFIRWWTVVPASANPTANSTCWCPAISWWNTLIFYDQVVNSGPRPSKPNSQLHELVPSNQLIKHSDFIWPGGEQWSQPQQKQQPTPRAGAQQSADRKRGRFTRGRVCSALFT